MKNIKISVFLISALAVAFISTNRVTYAADFQKKYEELKSQKDNLTDTERLNKIFETYWDYQMYTFPTWATYNGINDYNDRWTDNSLEGVRKRQKELQNPLDALYSIDRSALFAEDQLNFDLFELKLKVSQEGHQFPSYLMPINQMGGTFQSVPSTLEIMPAETESDFEDILSRLDKVNLLLANDLVIIKKGLKEKITPPRTTIRELPQQILNQIKDDANEAPMLLVFQNLPESIAEGKRQEIKKRAVEIYESKIKPALNNLYIYVKDEYLPNCRETFGLSDLPDGRKWYEYRVKYYTTTNLTPDEIFEIGNSEVRRIRAEMEKTKDDSGFEGDLAAFFEFLRTDPQFYHTSKEALLTGYRDISKRADAQLPKLFGLLPRLPYGVKAVPSYSEKSQTTAYYQGGSLEAARPGYFYANTYDLSSRPIWEMEALTLHEAVPGHHLQTSISKELEGLPKFRTNGWFTAYGEGWGLYSESLGEEMGFYQDPYSKFGQLTYEIWRAIRLVVDVGMHYKGWSRDKAIQFFKDNAGKSEHDITVEIDRYIVWPGQALAYKIGEMKIKELRKAATEKLGDKFDIRQFHDQVLGSGAVPLNILERNINQWIDAKTAE